MLVTTFKGPLDRLLVSASAAAAARRWTLAAAGVCAMLATAGVVTPHGAFAQAACTEIENDTQRLACYDRALRPARPAPQASQAPAAAPQASAPAPRASAAAPQAPAAATSAEPAPRSDLGTARSVEPRKSRSARAEAAAAPPAAPSAPGAAAAAAEPDELVPIVIVNVRTLAGRNDNVFTTDSGVVWQQTDNAKLLFPETPFNAHIKPGAMGSYFLVTENRNRAIRVRRQN
jgi:hypothetical protein